MTIQKKIIDAQNIDFKDIKELIQLDEQKARLQGFLSPAHKYTEDQKKDAEDNIQEIDTIQNILLEKYDFLA